MSSPSRRATAPLALPVLHLGSFSDLQLAQFAVGTPEGEDGTERTRSPGTSPSRLGAAGIPFLRDSNINRRKTMIINEASPPRRRYLPGLDSKDLPPLPLPSPVTDHPDYEGFLYVERREGREEEGREGEGRVERVVSVRGRVGGEHRKRPSPSRLSSAPSPPLPPDPPANRLHQQSHSMGAITLVNSANIYDPDSPRSAKPYGALGLTSRGPSTYDVSTSTVPGLGFLASVRDSDGPYPSDARPQALDTWPGQTRAFTKSLVDDPRITLDPQTAAPIPPIRVKIPPPQEEICLECLMRDRDLIHIDVTSPSVWSRPSDAEFHHMLRLERAYDREWQDRHGYLAYEGPHHEGRELIGDEEWDEREDERLRAVAAGDEGLRRVVRWRGFSWEEDERREDCGLPLGMRGRLEGGLYEEQLKKLAKMNVSPSAHRFKTLQKYLRDQAMTIGIPPEEEPDLESNIYLRDLERSEAIYRSNNGPSSNHAQYGHVDARMDHRARPPRPNGYPVRATMYEASTPARGYPAYDAQRYDTEPPPNAWPRLPALQLDVRKGRGISSPGLLELSSQPASRTTSRQSPTGSQFRRDQQYNFTADDSSTDWADPAAGNTPLRPFSFAVWAGRNGGASSTRSSPGSAGEEKGRSSVLGRWGGSVTSLFGGSQAGSHWGSHAGNSGSMMDMHLGLDIDRRRPMAPNTQPRSISMASPARPRFFSRASSSFMSHRGRPDDGGSMLTTVDTRMSGFDPAGPQASDVPPPNDKKKKGLKGILAKLRGRKSRGGQETGKPDSREPPSRDEDYSTPLAPPPPISFLVQRADRAANHTRTRTPSTSSLSAFSGSSSPPLPAPGSPSSIMMRLSSDMPGLPRQKSSPRLSSGISLRPTYEGSN